MVKSLSARLNSHWDRKQAVKWGGGVCCVWIDMCICIAFCVHGCVILLFKILEWELFVRACRPVWAAAVQPTKWAPPGWQRVAYSKESGCLALCLVWQTNAPLFAGGEGGCRVPLVDLLVCVVWATLHRFLAANKEALLVFVLMALLLFFLLLFMLIACRCGSQWSKLVDRSWVTLCSEAVIPGKPASAVLIGWLSSISVKHSYHRVGSGCCRPCNDVWVIFRGQGVYVYVCVMCVMNTETYIQQSAHTQF